jgi:hypothetical protein
MNAEVKDYVSKCSICQTHQPEREPLKSYDPAYDLPQQPWSVVGEDPFQFGQQQFLIIVYYWSGFFEVQELSKVTSKTAITASKGPICETRNSGLPNLQYWPQYGDLPRSSTINALFNLIHKWHRKSMDEMIRVIRIVFLDFRNAFNLINHNKLLEDMREVGVRSALVRWFASYLDERSHFTQFGKEASDFVNVLGGVPQGSKLGRITFLL